MDMSRWVFVLKQKTPHQDAVRTLDRSSNWMRSYTTNVHMNTDDTDNHMKRNRIVKEINIEEEEERRRKKSKKL